MLNRLGNSRSAANTASTRKGPASRCCRSERVLGSCPFAAEDQARSQPRRSAASWYRNLVEAENVRDVNVRPTVAALLCLFFAAACARPPSAPTARSESSRCTSEVGPGEARCPPGLVCCFPDRGMSSPPQFGQCTAPCDPSTQFCHGGCVNDPRVAQRETAPVFNVPGHDAGFAEDAGTLGESTRAQKKVRGGSLPAGSVCGQMSIKMSGGDECADGLVCCFAPSGIYNPNAQAHCMPPCHAGEPFCQSGCYNPPVG